MAILAAKQAGFWSRAFGRGGGGALPGVIAQRIDPEINAKLTQNLAKGVILVTGTNGKTTTAKMITEILENAGMKVLNNSGGSNLSRGIASALISRASIFGSLKADIGVYEVDEATMPELIKNLKFKIQNGPSTVIPAHQRSDKHPAEIQKNSDSGQACLPARQARMTKNKSQIKAIMVTNIFRDQLDRYGEVDKTAAIIEKAIKDAPDAKLILNADDPMVASLGKGKDNVLYFGVQDTRISASSELAIDSKDCLVCGSELNYARRYYGHIGVYECPNCGFKRPNPQISAKDIRLEAGSITAKMIIKRESFDLKLPMVGLYNIYNALAATAAASFLEVKSAAIAKTLSHLKPAFGRMESFEKNGKKAIIHLVKNPTGFNQVVEAISSTRKPKTALLILNDNFADGTDISWIWDCEYEVFKNYFSNIVVSGIRSEDLRLRLKYADVSSKIITVKKDISEALDTAIKKTGPNEKLYILPTYTAMLELRNLLVKEKILDNYWT